MMKADLPNPVKKAWLGSKRKFYPTWYSHTAFLKIHDNSWNMFCFPIKLPSVENHELSSAVTSCNYHRFPHGSHRAPRPLAVRSCVFGQSSCRCFFYATQRLLSFRMFLFYFRTWQVRCAISTSYKLQCLQFNILWKIQDIPGLQLALFWKNAVALCLPAHWAPIVAVALLGIVPVSMFQFEGPKTTETGITHSSWKCCVSILKN